VVVLEATSRVGGKLRTGEIAGVPVEDGADSLLARRPEAVTLARDVGLADALEAPTTFAASLLTSDGLRDMPSGTLLGVPTDLDAVVAAGLLSSAQVMHLQRGWPTAGEPLLAPGADTSVADLIGPQLGRTVLEECVEPLLGGVYAGRTDELSARATMPGLATAAEHTSRVVDAAAEALRQARSEYSSVSSGSRGPGRVSPSPFVGVRGGLERLAAALGSLPDIDVRTGVVVRGILTGTERRWRLVTGSAASSTVIDADALVLAVPGTPMRRLLAGVAPYAAAALDGLDYASVGLVSVAYPAGVGSRLPKGSGLLVPPRRRRTVKAATFVSAKWSWVAAVDPSVSVVRASVGRRGEESVLQRDDAELASLVLADLQDMLGLAEVEPIAWRVTRWGGGLPQYTVGHVDRVASVRRRLVASPGLFAAGAALDGVGIAACVESGQHAAEDVVAFLTSTPPGADATMAPLETGGTGRTDRD
jgi:oxygen-dependent protoporphyrinogen oxidase